MRAFIAIELPDDLRSRVAAYVGTLPRRGDIRWCAPQQLHLTLKFLGELPDAQVDQTCAAMRTAAESVAPFDLSIGGLGAFPAKQSPRVAWLGVNDLADGCGQWLRAAEPALEQLGFPPEPRAFHPHITLGRARPPGGVAALRTVLGSAEPPPSGAFRVEEVVLFESRLSPRGATYHAVARATLGGD